MTWEIWVRDVKAGRWPTVDALPPERARSAHAKRDAAALAQKWAKERGALTLAFEVGGAVAVLAMPNGKTFDVRVHRAWTIAELEANPPGGLGKLTPLRKAEVWETA